MTTGGPAKGGVRGPNGCVAADHPLAAQAGLRVIAAGGSAADAAVAMAATMTVVQPHFSQLGGDLFALTFTAETGDVRALNASGPAPAGLDLATYQAQGAIPRHGPLSVTTPGCVDGWWRLHERHGRLPWASLFEGAMAYARDGFPASRQLARFLPFGREKAYPASYLRQAFGRVTGDGGQEVVQPELAETLTQLAAGGRDAFYTGEFARKAVETLTALGAPWTLEDWRPPARWEEPLRIGFAGLTVHTQPPPSQGFVLALALGLYSRLLRERGEEPRPLLQREALRLAFAVRQREAGDPDHCGFEARALLEPGALEALLATTPVPAAATDGDTTCMLAVDGEGNAVALIQSVFAPWGSGVFVPGTGVLLNNRMTGFTLEPGHPNTLAAGKRPLHTLHNWLATVAPPPLTPLAAKSGAGPLPAELRALGGTPGAMQQPQTNLQLIDAILGERRDVQDAVDAPRWGFEIDDTGAGSMERIAVEQRPGEELTACFERAGLDVVARPAWDWRMGRAYVAALGAGGWSAAADLRGEGLALAW